MPFNLAEALQRVNQSNLSYPNRIIAQMHTYNTDLRLQGERFAKAKSEHDRLKAKHTINKRYGLSGQTAEKSGDMCGVYADAQDEVAALDLEYRLAEQMVAADKSKLGILQAELEKWRTEQANDRAADSFTARTGV